MKKPTVTIGIPAYNEEANIGNLLKALMKQKQSNFTIKEIIVVSDASTDNTDKIVRSFNSRQISLIRNSKRIGKALGENKIINKFNSDILLIFDADVLPKNNNLIANAVNAFNDKKTGLVGGKVTPIEPVNWVESILFLSKKIKQKIFENYNNGNNLFLCHGAIRAFSKDLIKSFKWKATAGEDAYSYLFCVSKGYRFKYDSNVEVVYKLPGNLNDHLHQSVRFLGGKKEMVKHFDSKLVKDSYSIPISIQIKVFVEYLIKQPILTIVYVFIYLYASILSLFKNYTVAVWEIADSSKKFKAYQ